MFNYLRILFTRFTQSADDARRVNLDLGEVEQQAEQRWATPDMQVSPYVLDAYERGALTDEELAAISDCRDLDLQERVSADIEYGTLKTMDRIRAALV